MAKSPKPAEIPVLPMELRLGDRLADERAEWRVIGPPYSTGGGKIVHVRVESVKKPGVTEIRSWSAHEPRGDQASVSAGSSDLYGAMRAYTEAALRLLREACPAGPPTIIHGLDDWRRDPDGMFRLYDREEPFWVDCTSELTQALKPSASRAAG